MPKTKKQMRVRMFEIMNESNRVDLDKITSWLHNISCDYLIVLHDKDAPRTPHYHIFVKMVDARTFEDIARQCDIEKQYIQRIEKWKNALAYAFHLTDNAKDDGKYQYDESAVIDYLNVDIKKVFQLSDEYQNAKKHRDDITQLLIKYGNCEISKSDMLQSMNAEDYNSFAIMFKRMQEYRIMKVRDRNMNVIYITGGSGSGKTTLAKYMARIMNYDFFVSGSGRDILDGYDKEECIILDDLRADVFTKAELFKLTDNNTNSSVKSRFKNKDISYCKLMIITSIKAPHDLYNWNTNTLEDKDETFNQFARRLQDKYLLIKDSGEILECKYDLDYTKVIKKLADVSMNDVFLLLGIEKKVGTSIMDDIFKKIKEDTKEKRDTLENTEDLPF